MDDAAPSSIPFPEPSGENAGTAPAAQGRWYFEDPVTGRMVQIDAILTTPEAWNDLPESGSPLWLARRLGDRLIALRGRF